MTNGTVSAWRIFVLTLVTLIGVSTQAFSDEGDEATGVDPRIAAIFKKAFYSEIYIENKCQDNVARLLVALREKGIPIEGLTAIEIINKGLENFGMVAAHATRTYAMNWFHHVVLYDGVFIYDLDFTQKPTPLTPPRYLHKMFKSDTDQADRQLCQKRLGRYELTFRPSLLYLQRYKREPVPGHFNREPVTKRVSQIPGWGCDYSGN